MIYTQKWPLPMDFPPQNVTYICSIKKEEHMFPEKGSYRACKCTSHASNMKRFEIVCDSEVSNFG